MGYSSLGRWEESHFRSTYLYPSPTTFVSFAFVHQPQLKRPTFRRTWGASRTEVSGLKEAKAL
jgi:hypothetical protein